MPRVNAVTDIPLHPLFVHVPVVLIPLILVMVIPGIFSRRWADRLSPVTLGLSFVAAVGSLLATSSGESLEEALGEQSALLDQHAQLGEMTRNLALLLFLVLLVQAALQWSGSPARLREWGAAHPGIVRALPWVAALACVAATVFVVLAGHAGAQLVWLGQG